jgi:hypothetical protein
MGFMATFAHLKIIKQVAIRPNTTQPFVDEAIIV